MNVLVTGATGFLGQWLTQRLLNDGHSVRVLRRSFSDSSLDQRAVESCQGDVTDAESLVKACKSMDVVFHLAGVVGYSKAQLKLMEDVNVGGTANVIAACKKASIRRLIHMSSVTAIGASFDGAVLDENSPYSVAHLHLGYFDTKHRGEQLVQAAVKRGEIDAVILNPSTIYGAGDAKKDSRKVQVKVAKGIFPFYTSGGVSVVAVEDVVDAICASVEKGRTGERYILAGENLTIKSLFSMIAAEAGVAPPKIYLPNLAVHAIGRVGDFLEASGKKGPLNSENAWTSILYHWFDSSKARRELGFRQRPAREAIASSVGWMKEEHFL